MRSRDPDYLTAQRSELRKRPFSFDGVGLSLLVWLGDPFWRVQTLAILFVVGLTGLTFWELRHPNPVVNLRSLGERNFTAYCIIVFGAYAVLYAASTSLPALLQSLFGYDALNAGLVMSPAGFFAVVGINSIACALAKRSIPSTRLRIPSLVRLPDSSCSRAAIQSPRSNGHCRRSPMCASNRHRRSPISMCSGCWRLSWPRSWS